MPLVRPEHLEQFATSAEAPFSLGDLIRKLVYTTIPAERIDFLTFHSGTANNLPGWDGTVSLHATATEGPHRSLWELSTQDADARKIRADFKKRLDEPLPDGWVRGETTLALVTLRKLQDRFGLEAELRKIADGKWLDVQIVDAPALAQWIEQFPSLETWCAEELNIGNRRFGKSLGRFWRDWSESTRPPMSTELVVAGRDAEEFKKAFQPAAGETLTLQADSPHEAAAYLHAMLMKTQSAEVVERTVANCMVVENEEHAVSYSDEKKPTGAVPVTVLLPPATSAANNLANKGHYVIKAVGRAAHSATRGIVRIRRGLASDIARALHESMGLTEERAATEARACGSSVSVWALWTRYEDAGAADQDLPVWAQSSNPRGTLPAILAGAWSESEPGDKATIEQLCRSQPYDQYMESLAGFVHCDSPLLERTGSVITVVAPTAAFALAYRQLTVNHLNALGTAVRASLREVGEEVDAALAAGLPLPTTARAGASEWLRRGLVESVLRLSAFAERLDRDGVAHHFGDTQTFVDELVRSVLTESKHPLYVYALEHDLAVLAEAAPTVFLQGLEKALLSDDEIVSALAERVAARGGCREGPVGDKAT